MLPSTVHRRATDSLVAAAAAGSCYVTQSHGPACRSVDALLWHCLDAVRAPGPALSAAVPAGFLSCGSSVQPLRRRSPLLARGGGGAGLAYQRKLTSSESRRLVGVSSPRQAQLSGFTTAKAADSKTRPVQSSGARKRRASAAPPPAAQRGPETERPAEPNPCCPQASTFSL